MCLKYDRRPRCGSREGNTARRGRGNFLGWFCDEYPDDRHLVKSYTFRWDLCQPRGDDKGATDRQMTKTSARRQAWCLRRWPIFYNCLSPAGTGDGCEGELEPTSKVMIWRDISWGISCYLALKSIVNNQQRKYYREFAMTHDFAHLRFVKVVMVIIPIYVSLFSWVLIKQKTLT